MGRRMEREGIDMYIQLTHAVIHQKLTPHCKATIFQLKNLKKEKVDEGRPSLELIPYYKLSTP